MQVDSSQPLSIQERSCPDDLEGSDANNSKNKLQSAPPMKGSKSLHKKPKYVCPICNRKYPKAQALGGHMSKAHPHKSDQYQYKQQRRNERVEERKVLAAAKIIYFEEFGAGPITYRNKLNQIKARLKEQWAGQAALSVPNDAEDQEMQSVGVHSKGSSGIQFTTSKQGSNASRANTASTICDENE